MTSWYSRNPRPKWLDDPLDREYGGFGDDLRILFLNLDAPTLEGIFEDYAREFGKRRAAYAREVYSDWREGRVVMSDMIRERLLKIVPRHLPFDTKYELISSLWHRLLPQGSV